MTANKTNDTTNHTTMTTMTTMKTMENWYVCGRSLTDMSDERTCLGPFMSALHADDHRLTAITELQFTTTLVLPVSRFNPFKAQELRRKYNCIHNDHACGVTKVKLVKYAPFSPSVLSMAIDDRNALDESYRQQEREFGKL